MNKRHHHQEPPNGGSDQILVRQGWSVAIRREDGTEFLASTGLGIGRAIWPLSFRANAVKHKRDLKEHGFKARVVRVTFTDPEILPNATAQTPPESGAKNL